MSSPIPILQKIRMLASVDATLQGYLLGENNTFRWFDTQLPKGYVAQGTCVTVQQISDVMMYSQSGPLSLDWVRVQVNCWDMNSVVAKNLAAYLVLGFFPGANFTVQNQFTSPPTSAPPAPNFKLSQRGVLDFSVQPAAAWVETLDFRVGNNVNF
jgi:hypothetical protein